MAVSAAWVGPLRSELEGQVTWSEGTGASALPFVPRGKGSSLGGGRAAVNRGGGRVGQDGRGCLASGPGHRGRLARRPGWRGRKTWSQSLQ